MRAFLVLLVFSSACFGANELSSDGDFGPPNDGVGGAAAMCMTDQECVLASSKCCECPSFATRFDDPVATACESVDCPTMTCSATLRAACDVATFQCVLACEPLACPASCELGFAADEYGCLSCACAPPPATSTVCTKDTDCVETRADCCGCAAGGMDTAVLASEASRYDAGLNCPPMPACPGVNTCEVGAQPRCVQGSCELLTEPLPSNACGRADLPACPAGTVCTVNASDPANLYGVGTCAPP
ncbi:MAG TPA: hypothetical protein VFQ53_28525 [Kofleriaceae bacterium]|nr:hypothetical protein [Kofleriaceae bacterium]